MYHPNAVLDRTNYILDVDMMRRFWQGFNTGEVSEELFDLTTDILDECGGHYTVWVYRRKMLVKLKMPIEDEIRWARNFAESNPKNYQIWHHRLALVVMAPRLASEELLRILIDLEASPKNYHAWQYRQWLLKSHGGSLQDELDLIHELLRLDPYNNSAWNHRFFALFSGVFPMDKDEAWWESELAFVNDKLGIDETNTSILLYLQAIQNKR